MVTRVCAIAFALALATPARADSPWTQGVSEEQKAAAKKLLDAGNALLLENKYVEALEQYTAALKVWDHPAIRFNIVRCLIQLQRNVEAYDNLKLALKFGKAPLEDAVYNEALAYEKLLSTQVSDLTVRCSQPGVSVTLDGKPLATCPANETRRVSPGPHQIVGTKQGLLPKTLELVVIGGKPMAVDLELAPLEAGARIVHRWPGYVPWSVIGGGAVVLGVGGLLQYIAGEQMRSYDQFVDGRCTGNCPESELADIAYLKTGAETKSAIGISLMIGGGAALATGAVLLYLNRGRTVYPEAMTVTPTQGGAAVSWRGSF